MKKKMLISILSDMHVAYVGNGATIDQITSAVMRVRHLDATSVKFGSTFEETYLLNSVEYDILDDLCNPDEKRSNPVFVRISGAKAFCR